MSKKSTSKTYQPKSSGRILKIYVAGPYTPTSGNLHDAVRKAHQNTLRAIGLGLKIIEKGHLPFIPHLTHYIHIESKVALPKAFFQRYDFAWLEHCDALYFMGASEGADRELEWAKDHGLRIFTQLSQVPGVSNRRH